jgi:hypothetical protein
MILTISTKERIKIAETKITGMFFIATHRDIVNDKAVWISVSGSGVPFFFDLFSDEGDWVSGGRFKVPMEAVDDQCHISFSPGDLRLLSR